MAQQWAAFAKPDASLANLDSAALQQFVASFEAMTAGASAFAQELSKQREALLLGSDPKAAASAEMLKALSASIHQLELIRDASVAIVARTAPEELASIGALTESLQAKLAPKELQLKEDAEQKAARVKAMLYNFPGFLGSEPITTLASLVTAQWGKDHDIDSGRAKALLLWSYDVPTSHAPPHGPQQLVITSRGVRAVGRDGLARFPTASELAAAGMEWAQLEKALNTLLASANKGTAEPITVSLLPDDRLYTNGTVPSVDVAAMNQEWQAALAIKDPSTRAGEMIRVLNEYLAPMSAGEVRDFVNRALRSIAQMDRGSTTERQGHAESQLAVVATLIAHLERFPFKRSNLAGLNDLAKQVIDHLNGSIYERSLYQQWLEHWDIDSKFGY